MQKIGLNKPGEAEKASEFKHYKYVKSELKIKSDLQERGCSIEIVQTST